MSGGKLPFLTVSSSTNCEPFRIDCDPSPLSNRVGCATTLKSLLSLNPKAGVAKLVYALDSKSSERQAHVGSSPTSGTTFPS
jgi:hypothetical protein